ncbi:unnamed protein product, partial [Medioppia subpectinata]
MKQLLSPLTTCLASILNGKRPLQRRLRGHEVTGSDDTCNESVSHESMDLALKSVNEIFCDKKSRKLLLEEFVFNSSDKNYAKNRTAKIFVNKILAVKREPLPWITSYASHYTFDENKYQTRHTQYKLFSRCISSYTHHNYSQIRTFKSKPTTGIGSGTRSRNTEKTSQEQTSVGNMKLGSIFGLSKEKHKETESDKMREILNDGNLSVEDKNSLKIAFAEGYLAAEPRPKMSSKLRFFNIFRDLMGIALIIAILFSFMDIVGPSGGRRGWRSFLRDPERFSVLGGKLPKGVLLVGPPGTGKTLLARAVAGEAGVPFFHAAGPEFDEILVGQGARRVRDLFSTAKLKAPCVVFIDEIDSVGAKRSTSVLHPYANQTINQLLTEMDGFRQNEGVIVLGATNRRDDLDRALLRPGRFDVEVQVPVPDFKGRKEIIDLYLSKVKYSSDVKVEMLARGTTGFTGADLENLVNQAALRAAID